MKYRPLGSTGEKVSVLSFGASSLGSVFRETDDLESIRTVHAALDGGINLIDVSPYYGLTKAETVLGEALSQVARDRYLLATKAGRYGEREFDYSRERILRSVEESCRRLHTDYLDILFLHDIEFVPYEEVAAEAFETLRELKRQGVIRFSGISGLPLSVLARSLEDEAAPADVILSYCHYSLNDTTLLELLPLLEAKRAGLVNASPLSMGLLSMRPAPEWHPASEDIRRACHEAARCCESHGSDIAKLAIQFATADERIPTTLVSTASSANITRNISWTDEPMDRELLRKVLAILAPVQGRSWPSGREEYNQTIRA
ncbi:aldo/keto reductase [Paenibacillus sambharensis]|uniref:Aldo/keto reductase n=1 Tax=Paenibacillus sambharensis TaxID=1803190 RepID=A0A2W1L808_9BACL|nr:aldo/keto reductase [Paenibacillus sambharensis]PZD96288.1 aldo/keto reductase [Paenibacillus sambharensis]